MLEHVASPHGVVQIHAAQLYVLWYNYCHHDYCTYIYVHAVRRVAMQCGLFSSVERRQHCTFTIETITRRRFIEPLPEGYLCIMCILKLILQCQGILYGISYGYGYAWFANFLKPRPQRVRNLPDNLCVRRAKKRNNNAPAN